jgi:hypothetical protein
MEHIITKHWLVVSPEMSYIDVIFDGMGPTEYFCCVISIEATNSRDAKIKALKTKEFEPWIKQCRSDGINPFVGLKIEIPKCKHGICMCDLHEEDEICELCENELLHDKENLDENSSVNFN